MQTRDFFGFIVSYLCMTCGDHLVIISKLDLRFKYLFYSEPKFWGNLCTDSAPSGHSLPLPLSALYLETSQVALMVKNPPADAGYIREMGWEDPLEEGTAAHSSILTWGIPWTEKPGGLQSMGPVARRHDWSYLACMLSCISQETNTNLQEIEGKSQGVSPSPSPPKASSPYL